MRLLLDTHALLWMLAKPEELRPDTQALLTASGQALWFSPASLYEYHYKVATGKLEPTVADIRAAALASGLTERPITGLHAQHAARLPLHHRDPFDRLLIAQAMLDDLTLVTRDGVFPAYGVSLLPC